MVVVVANGLWTQLIVPYVQIVRDSLITRTLRVGRGNWVLLAIAQTLTVPALAAAPQLAESVDTTVASPDVSAPAPAPQIGADSPTAQTAPSATTFTDVHAANVTPIQPGNRTAVEADGTPGFAKQFPNRNVEMDRGATEAHSKSSGTHSRSVAAMLDAGLPDGAVVGLAYRPAFWTRIQAGGGYNSISPGMRLGAVLVPFSQGPSVTVEGGYYFEGDANSIIGSFAGPTYSKTRTLQRVGYQFVNFHAGLDFGSTSATFFVHGGMTYLHTTLHDANDVFGGQTVSSQGEVTTYTFHQDISLKLWFPSCKLGFLVYIV